LWNQYKRPRRQVTLMPIKSMTEFKKTIFPQAGVKAEAEEDPIACAFLVAKTIENVYRKPGTLAKIAGGYAEAGQYDKALELAKTIKGAGWKARALTEIASAYTKTGQKKKALEMLSRSLEVVKTIKYAAWKAEALTEIASVYTKTGQKVNDKAKKILHEIIRDVE